MAVKPKTSPASSSSPSDTQPTNSLSTISGFVTDDGDEYQKLLNDRVRLGILSCLAVSERLTFNELKAVLEVSDGNLSTHARKLENAEFIVCSKTFSDRTPKTEYALTERGRAALERHLQHMHALLKATSQD